MHSRGLLEQLRDEDLGEHGAVMGALRDEVYVQQMLEADRERQQEMEQRMVEVAGLGSSPGRETQEAAAVGQDLDRARQRVQAREHELYEAEQRTKRARQEASAKRVRRDEEKTLVQGWIAHGAQEFDHSTELNRGQLSTPALEILHTAVTSVSQLLALDLPSMRLMGLSTLDRRLLDSIRLRAAEWAAENSPEDDLHKHIEQLKEQLSAKDAHIQELTTDRLEYRRRTAVLERQLPDGRDISGRAFSPGMQQQHPQPQRRDSWSSVAVEDGPPDVKAAFNAIAHPRRRIDTRASPAAWQSAELSGNWGSFSAEDRDSGRPPAQMSDTRGSRRAAPTGRPGTGADPGEGPAHSRRRRSDLTVDEPERSAARRADRSEERPSAPPSQCQPTLVEDGDTDGRRLEAQKQKEKRKSKKRGKSKKRTKQDTSTATVKAAAAHMPSMVSIQAEEDAQAREQSIDSAPEEERRRRVTTPHTGPPELERGAVLSRTPASASTAAASGQSYQEDVDGVRDTAHSKLARVPEPTGRTPTGRTPTGRSPHEESDPGNREEQEETVAPQRDSRSFSDGSDAAPAADSNHLIADDYALLQGAQEHGYSGEQFDGTPPVEPEPEPEDPTEEVSISCTGWQNSKGIPSLAQEKQHILYDLEVKKGRKTYTIQRRWKACQDLDTPCCSKLKSSKLPG